MNDKMQMFEIAEILNTISLKLQEKGFRISGYDNLGDRLIVSIEREE